MAVSSWPGAADPGRLRCCWREMAGRQCTGCTERAQEHFPVELLRESLPRWTEHHALQR